jgi:hypothetical protein
MHIGLSSDSDESLTSFSIDQPSRLRFCSPLIPLEVAVSQILLDERSRDWIPEDKRTYMYMLRSTDEFNFKLADISVTIHEERAWDVPREFESKFSPLGTIHLQTSGAVNHHLSPNALVFLPFSETATCLHFYLSIGGQNLVDIYNATATLIFR